MNRAEVVLAAVRELVDRGHEVAMSPAVSGAPTITRIDGVPVEMAFQEIPKRREVAANGVSLIDVPAAPLWRFGATEEHADYTDAWTGEQLAEVAEHHLARVLERRRLADRTRNDRDERPRP